VTNTTNAAPNQTSLLDNAKALAAGLLSSAAESQNLRRAPDATINAFLKSGLYRLALPARFGGEDSRADQQVDVVIELGKGDGSQAAVLASFLRNAQQLARFPTRAQDEVWMEDRAALISASQSPGGQLEAVTDGYVVSGTWSFAIGIDHARWLLAGTLKGDGDERRPVLILVPKASASITDDWHVAGLEGAGAKSFSLTGVRVPAHRVLEVGPSVPAPLTLAAVGIGVVHTMLEDLIAMARDTTKRSPRAAYSVGTAMRIAESHAELTAARATLLEAATQGPDATSHSVLGSAYGALLASRAANRVFAGGGAKVNLLSNRMQRALLDAHALCSLEGLRWDPAATTYGRSRIGAAV
jgi:alkylation response protein AidB-like acyl-CoA dehydrogenase